MRLKHNTERLSARVWYDGTLPDGQRVGFMPTQNSLAGGAPGVLTDEKQELIGGGRFFGQLLRNQMLELNPVQEQA